MVINKSQGTQGFYMSPYIYQQESSIYFTILTYRHHFFKVKQFSEKYNLRVA